MRSIALIAAAFMFLFSLEKAKARKADMTCCAAYVRF
jgi:hypothetical protein